MDEFHYFVIRDGVDMHARRPILTASAALTYAQEAKRMYPDSIICVQVTFSD